MNNAGCPMINQAGLTWRRLAAGATVTERDVMRWRGEGPGRTGPVHRAIAALARDLPAGDGRTPGGGHDGGEG